MSAQDHPPPAVVGTINPRGLEALLGQPAAERMVDLVEARFDLLLGDAPPSPQGQAQAQVDGTSQLPALRPYLASCAALERTGTPVLATVRLAADGGRWVADEAARLPWLREALAVVSWVDVEVDSVLTTEVVSRAHAQGRRAIVSHHDFTGTPDAGTLQVLIDRARGLGADIVKIATLVRSREDHDSLIDVLRRQRRSDAGAPVALIGMGPEGTSLRSYLPSVGSRLTYGYLDAVAAPGQLHAHQLVQRLIADCPLYAAHRRDQGRL